MIEIFALLRCYPAYIDDQLQTFRDSMSVQSSKVQRSKKTAWPIGCPETPVSTSLLRVTSDKSEDLKQVPALRRNLLPAASRTVGSSETLVLVYLSIWLNGDTNRKANFSKFVVKMITARMTNRPVFSAHEDWGWKKLIDFISNVNGRNPLGQGFSDFFAGVRLNEIRHFCIRAIFSFCQSCD